MMTSRAALQPDRAYVWFWLPGRTDPTLVGRADQEGKTLTFTYRSGYLDQEDAIPIFTELPLERGVQVPRSDIHGCIADAGPDSWGQRVILNERLGAGVHDTTELTHLSYLTSAGSDRIGALDFQVEEGDYRGTDPVDSSLGDLMESARKVEDGVPLSPDLDSALLRGSSIGGARPKALLDDSKRGLIAKFGAANDIYPVVQGEFVATRLAALCGLEAAKSGIKDVMDKKVLLLERFDRTDSGTRRSMVSALTILGLSETEARYASYADLAHIIRREFGESGKTLKELFSRITFNILVSNLDDHARNQSAFWDGRELSLTPFYDICPSPRTGGEVQQVMAIGEDGWRYSQLAGCIRRSATYQLTKSDAQAIVDHQVATIKENWDEVCDEAGLNAVQRDDFYGKQFLNPFAFEDARS